MESELLKRLDVIMTKLEQGNPPKIWAAEDIAEWLGLSIYTIKQAVVVRPGFPPAILATGAKEGQKRWFADEVIEWVRKNRCTLPAGRQSKRRRTAG